MKLGIGIGIGIGLGMALQELRSLISNLVTYYKLGNNAASTAVLDARGYSNGTAQRNTNLMHVAGKLGGALSFNGTSDYINTNNNFQAIFSKDFSIADWFYWDLNNPNIGGYGVNNPATSTCMVLIENPYMEPTSFLTELEYLLPANKNLLLAASGGFTESQWIFWTATVSQQGGNIVGKLYINGILQDTQQLNSASMSSYNCGKKFYLGAVNIDDLSIAFYDNRTHDNFMIFDKALSQVEVDALYNGGSGIAL